MRNPSFDRSKSEDPSSKRSKHAGPAQRPRLQEQVGEDRDDLRVEQAGRAEAAAARRAAHAVRRAVAHTVGRRAASHACGDTGEASAAPAREASAAPAICAGPAPAGQANKLNLSFGHDSCTNSRLCTATCDSCTSSLRDQA